MSDFRLLFWNSGQFWTILPPFTKVSLYGGDLKIFKNFFPDLLPMNNKLDIACSTSLVYCKHLILLKNTTFYLRSNILQRFEHYSSSGVKVSRGVFLEAYRKEKFLDVESRVFLHLVAGYLMIFPH